MVSGSQTGETACRALPAGNGWTCASLVVMARHGGKRYREVVSILGAAQVRLGATHTARSLHSAAATSVISAPGNVKRVPNRRTENVSIDVDPAWAAEGWAVVRHGLRQRVGQPGSAAVVGSVASPCVRGVRRGARGAGRTGLDSGRGRRTRNRLVPIAGRWGIGPPRSRRRVRRQIQVELSGVVEAGSRGRCRCCRIWRGRRGASISASPPALRTFSNGQSNRGPVGSRARSRT